MSTLLELNHISKTFPGVKALDDVSLELRGGEVLGLCGENGAGKSTLMKILTGIYTADEGGSMHFRGQPLTVSGPREAQEKGISIIHQELNLVGDLTVAQNIFMGRESRVGGFGINDKAQFKAAQELLDQLNISVDPRAYPRDLSVARQQMVEIARALSFESKVLVMDEPTAALTDSEIEVLFRIIREFVKEDTGLVYISHRMDEITEITDRVSVLRDGQYVDSVVTKDSSIREIISLMVGREIASDVRPAPKDFSQSEVVLKVQGLSTRSLLKGLDFELHRGEILGFAGLMGAGRTEMGRALVGADRISAGEITINGKKVNNRNPAKAVSNGIGYLSEDRKRYGLLLDQDVTANNALSSLTTKFSTAGFLNERAMSQAASEMREKLAVKTPSINQLLRNLSGGNQQKVIIGKWLTRDCDILIVDEPTRGIDVGAKQEIYELLESLTAAGKSIIVISSELPEVLRISDRIVCMCDGRITGILDNAEANQENIMELCTQFRQETLEVA